jgi:Mn2+/Fe2+ NRAMP family transporter
MWLIGTGILLLLVLIVLLIEQEWADAFMFVLIVLTVCGFIYFFAYPR